MNYLHSEVKINESLIKNLFNLAKTQSFNDFTINVKSGSKKGDNYSSNILQIDIIGERNNKNDILKLISKAPLQGKLAEEISLHHIFVKEIYIYKEILQKFEQMQNFLSLDETDLIKFAKCYATSEELNNEFLIMEDLKANGYAMFDRFNYLDFSHCSLVLKTLARLHGLSYVLKVKEPQNFEMYAKECKEVLYGDDAVCDFKSFDNIVQSGVKLATETIKDDIIVEKIKKLCTNTYEVFKKSVTSDELSVIGHGDCWNNNMLYKYEDGLPVKVCFVDYQIARVCSPVIDIHCFIYHCTSSEFRRKYFYILLDLYHDTLRSSTAAFSLDIDQFYPKDKFLEDMTNKSQFAVLTTLFQLMFVTRLSEESIDLNEIISGNFNYTEGKNFEMYKERLNGVISDFVYFGYI